jgi:hypothetical protein
LGPFKFKGRPLFGERHHNVIRVLACFNPQRPSLVLAQTALASSSDPAICWRMENERAFRWGVVALGLAPVALTVILVFAIAK